MKSPLPIADRIAPPIRGFTLIELLVAAGITAIMASVIVLFAGNTLKFWARNTARIDAAAQARLVLDQLTLDLQSALYRDDGATWLAANILPATVNSAGLWSNNTSGAGRLAVPKPTSAAANSADDGNSIDLLSERQSLPEKGRFADARYGVGGTWLRFFTNARSRNLATDVSTVSAPVAVAYQIIRRAPSSTTSLADHRYYLHRTEVRPASTTSGTVRRGTIDVGYNLADPRYTTPSTGNDGSNIADPYALRHPGSATNLDAVLGENVVDFGIRLYVYVPNVSGTPPALTQIFPAGRTDLTHTATLPAAVGAADKTKLGSCFPDVVDVMVRILGDEGARQLALVESGRTAVPPGLTQQQFWWRTADANSQVFTRRIVLRAQPL